MARGPDAEDAVDGTGEQATGRPERPGGPRWWVAGLTGVLGVVVGVVGVGLVTPGGFDQPTAAGQSAAPAATGNPAPQAVQSGGAAVTAEVNPACLRVINEAQNIYGIVNGIGDAASSLDFARLDEVVRRLQPVQPRLQADLTDCNVSTRLSNGDLAPSASAAPTTPPATPSPTS